MSLKNTLESKNLAAERMLTDDFTAQEFFAEREFDAPRERLFKAWTNSERLAQWRVPRGFINRVCDWDAARSDREIFAVMGAPNAECCPMGGEFREIVAPEKLVFYCGALK
jgi:uncharacterized protein YndB with AHSA1/START domain